MLRKRDEGGRGATLLLVGLLIVALGVGGAYLFFDGSDTRTPEGEVDSSPTVEDGPSSVLDEPVESFGWGEVLLEVEREPDGINVYFVNEGRVTFADVVIRCVNKYRKDFDAVSCYGFPSPEALAAADIDPETGSIGVKCWQAYYSVSGRGKTEKESGGAIDNGQAGDNGCPTT